MVPIHLRAKSTTPTYNGQYVKGTSRECAAEVNTQLPSEKSWEANLECMKISPCGTKDGVI